MNDKEKELILMYFDKMQWMWWMEIGDKCWWIVTTTNELFDKYDIWWQMVTQSFEMCDKWWWCSKEWQMVTRCNGIFDKWWKQGMKCVISGKTYGVCDIWQWIMQNVMIMANREKGNKMWCCVWQMASPSILFCDKLWWMWWIVTNGYKICLIV